MTSTQHEELCRRYIAETFQVPRSSVNFVVASVRPNWRANADDFPNLIATSWRGVLGPGTASTGRSPPIDRAKGDPMPRSGSCMQAVIALAVGLVAGAAPAYASVLCKRMGGGLLVRDTCKKHEQTLGPVQLDELGLRGPTGPIGPSGGGLKVLDATGAEVGLVTSLQSAYYGEQSARVVSEMTLPGASGPEFVGFSVSARGVTTSDYACNGYYGIYYRNADCTGDPFQTCDYGSCSSATGALLFTPVSVNTDGIGCFVRGGSEFRRGDFYHLINVHGPSIEAATSQCVTGGGTLLSPAVSCGNGSPLFCAQCCAFGHSVGVAPVHQVDFSTIWTPPFRLGR